MLKTMLGERFHNIWYVGEVSEEGVDKIIQYLTDFSSKAVGRVRLRFYIDKPGDISYLANIKRILLHNTSLSIVVEERLVDELQKDLASIDDEVILIRSKQSPLEIQDVERVKVIEVG